MRYSFEFRHIYSFFNKILLAICLIIFILMFWNSYVTVHQTLFIRKSILAINLVGIAILALIFCYVMNRYLSRKQFIITLFVVAFVIRLIWVITFLAPVESDFLIMYQAALEAAKGSFAFAQQPYFTTWVYQLGFTMYEALILHLFGEGKKVLELLNILYCTGTVIFIYLIAAKVFNEWCGRIAGILYACNISNILYGSVLTNQHLAVFLFYFACYLLVTKVFTNKYIWILIGVLLSLGDIIRPLGAFFLIAVIAFMILEGFFKSGEHTKFSVTKKMVGITAVFYLVHAVFSYSFMAAGVTQYSLSDRDPLWKFVIGLNYQTSGAYSQADVDHIRSIKDDETRKQKEWTTIEERIQDKTQLVSLFNKKFANMWGGKDAAAQWSLVPLKKTELANVLTLYERYTFMTSVLFGIAGLVFLIVRKRNDYPESLFLLLIIGYILIHLLIEIQTRYRYEIIPSFTIIQSYGFYMVYKWLLPKRLKSR